MIPPTAIAYWDRAFGGGVTAFDDGTVSLTIDGALGAARAAMILWVDDGRSRIALTPMIAERADLADSPPTPLPIVRERLVAAGFALNDPDLLFYAPTDHPLAAPTAGHVVRRLEPSDAAAFGAFHNAASPQDLDDAWVEFDHPVLFGSFVDGALVCAASTLPWDRSPLADLGILTLPDARGRGHARAVLTAIGRDARSTGQELQYRCQTDNAASVALARAGGLVAFGEWEVLRDPVA